MTAKRLFIFLGIFIFLILSLAGCSSSGGGTESPATYSISGRVGLNEPAAGGGQLTLLPPATGVTISLTGAATGSATTGTDGTFTITGLANGNYTVTPSKTDFIFALSSLAVTVSGGNITGTDFVATANPGPFYSISGAVSGVVTAGVTMTLSGGATSPASGFGVILPTVGTTITDTDGDYSFSGIPNGIYRVTPSRDGYTFNPMYHEETVSAGNITGVDFTATDAPAVCTQADLTGTWRMNRLRRGYHGDGSPISGEWLRARISFNSSGVATCLSYSDSTGVTSCPSPFDLTLTMNPTTCVITQTGDKAVSDGGHMTMTSNKNFAAGTGTNGTGAIGHSNYQLVIVQKEEGASYSAADLQSKSLVQHNLSLGYYNTWDYWTGTTDASGMLTISSETDPSGTTTPGATGLTLSVDSNGVVTISGGDMDSFQGFLSADKKTVVGTHTHGSGSSSIYSLDIVQITGTEFTIGPFAPGVAYGHMLGTGSTFAGWIHDTITVALGGGMTFSDWAASFSPSSAPTGYTGNVTTTSGTLTITGNPTYHGQVSHDGKFTVATQTGDSSTYWLSVTTK